MKIQRPTPVYVTGVGLFLIKLLVSYKLVKDQWLLYDSLLIIEKLMLIEYNEYGILF